MTRTEGSMSKQDVLREVAISIEGGSIHSFSDPFGVSGRLRQVHPIDMDPEARRDNNILRPENFRALIKYGTPRGERHGYFAVNATGFSVDIKNPIGNLGNYRLVTINFEPIVTLRDITPRMVFLTVKGAVDPTRGQPLSMATKEFATGAPVELHMEYFARVEAVKKYMMNN